MSTNTQITVLKPEDLYRAQWMIDAGISKAEIARRYGIKRLTLRCAFKKFDEYGLSAFSVRMLKDYIQPVVENRKLDDAYAEVVNRGLYRGTKGAFRRALTNANIRYLKNGGRR